MNADTSTVSPTFGASGWIAKETDGVGRGGKKQVGATLGVRLGVHVPVAVGVGEEGGASVNVGV
jgi:hypothetical protein